MTPSYASRLPAPAKVNLHLRVFGRRSDGFHEIDTLFQAIALRDDVILRRTTEGVRLTVQGADVGPDEENLAYRAAHMLLDAADDHGGFDVHLAKRIPAGAGLGGGSSDAAAVLRLGNRMLERPLPQGALCELGAALGSDVPFFLGSSPLARGTGRGERLEPLPSLPEASLVVVLPPVHVSTAEAYTGLADARRGGGEAPCFAQVTGAPANWTEVAHAAANDFEAVVPDRWPEVAASLAALRSAGGSPALLSGSGGACFGIFPDPDRARSVAARIEATLGWPAVATRTLETFPEPTAVEFPSV